MLLAHDLRFWTLPKASTTLTYVIDTCEYINEIGVIGADMLG